MKPRWRKLGDKTYDMEGFTIMWGTCLDYPWALLPPPQYPDQSHKHFKTLSDAKKAVRNMRKRQIQKNPRDYCYRKVKKQYKVFPSAYASGAIVQCRRRLGRNKFSLEKKYGLHGWFMRGGGKGWVDCKTGKPCGRKKGEKRKYPACRPTMRMCSSAMRKKRGRKRISWVRKNPVSKSIATVSETPKGWLWRERGEIYPSATAVAKAMKRESDMAVKRGLSAVIRQVSWIPTTSTGTKIVRAILHKNPVPPKAVSRVACRGLAKRRIYKRGGTAVGVARARDLCNRVNVSMRTVKRMSSYFARHRASREENRRRIADPVSPARIADELWGGTPGYRWAKKVLG